MHQAELTRRCEAALARVPFPSGALTLGTMVQAVEAAIGRPIELRPVETRPGEVSGCTFRREGRDVIEYDRAESSTYQANTIAHELSHLILDHEPKPRTKSAPLSAPLTMLDEGFLRLMLCRSVHDDDQEAEAETMAWLLFARAHPGVPEVRQPGTPLAQALGREPRRRWRRRAV